MLFHFRGTLGTLTRESSPPSAMVPAESCGLSQEPSKSPSAIFFWGEILPLLWAANTPWVWRGFWGVLKQTQKGAGKVPDVSKSPKICRVHPARDQDVGTGLAPLSQWMPVMGSEMGNGEQGSAELVLG